MIKKLFLIITMVFCGGVLGASPQNCDESEAQDSIEISLLTCAPGREAYAHYGHTAIRVRTVGCDTDLVYNYGCFDFSTPNFAMRFALGETDYQLGVYPYQLFEREYLSQGRRVWQQVLNITQEEAQEILRRLQTNALPQKRVYRYNFLFNNCTTKCRDVIELCCNGGVHWPKDIEEVTWRDMMHRYNQNHFWSRQGIDLCLGMGVDTVITIRDRMFSPMYMMQAAEGARIGHDRRLVSSTQLIIDPKDPYTAQQNEFMSLIAITLMIMVVVLRILVYQGPMPSFIHEFGNHSATIRTACDIVVWSLTGIFGLIISFLFCFSEHPSVGTNLLVLVINPLPLLALCLLRWQKSTWLLCAMLALTLTAVSLFILEVQIIPETAWFFCVYMFVSLADRIQQRFKKKSSVDF